MELLTKVIEGIETVNEAKASFKKWKTKSHEFITPFLLYKKQKNSFKKIQLEAFTEKSVADAYNAITLKPSYIVLAGESEIENPKTRKVQHFFVIKLFIEGLENVYVYSIPFKQEPETQFEMQNAKYAGCEINSLFPYSAPQGESSSCNTIKMDPKHPYDNRAAFLIGHMNEKRLWIDTQTVIADMYCKVSIEEKRQFELIFEISKFGRMTQDMNNEFIKFKNYFDSTYSPSFSNIKSEIQLGNTVL